jgi:O-antigen/teichoic acid export membrane protein
MMQNDRQNNKHRFESFSLGFICILPIVIVLTYIGIALDRYTPEVPLYGVLFFILLLVILIPTLMFFGAALWLAVARFFVSREVSEKFFIHFNFGNSSEFSRWLFERAYERNT